MNTEERLKLHFSGLDQSQLMLVAIYHSGERMRSMAALELLSRGSIEEADLLLLEARAPPEAAAQARKQLVSLELLALEQAASAGLVEEFDRIACASRYDEVREAAERRLARTYAIAIGQVKDNDWSALLRICLDARAPEEAKQMAEAAGFGILAEHAERARSERNPMFLGALLSGAFESAEVPVSWRKLISTAFTEVNTDLQITRLCKEGRYQEVQAICSDSAFPEGLSAKKEQYLKEAVLSAISLAVRTSDCSVLSSISSDAYLPAYLRAQAEDILLELRESQEKPAAQAEPESHSPSTGLFERPESNPQNASRQPQSGTLERSSSNPPGGFNWHALLRAYVDPSTPSQSKSRIESEALEYMDSIMAKASVDCDCTTPKLIFARSLCGNPAVAHWNSRFIRLLCAIAERQIALCMEEGEVIWNRSRGYHKLHEMSKDPLLPSEVRESARVAIIPAARRALDAYLDSGAYLCLRSMAAEVFLPDEIREEARLRVPAAAVNAAQGFSTKGHYWSIHQILQSGPFPAETQLLIISELNNAVRLQIQQMDSPAALTELHKIQEIFYLSEEIRAMVAEKHEEVARTALASMISEKKLREIAAFEQRPDVPHGAKILARRWIAQEVLDLTRSALADMPQKPRKLNTTPVIFTVRQPPKKTG